MDDKMSEKLSEKVSVNINSSTLSQIDLLVDNGYYSNRSDFINQALRASLAGQQSTLDRIIGQRGQSAGQKKEEWFIGVCTLTAEDVEELCRQGGGYAVTGYGVLGIGEDVDPERLFAAVRTIRVKGKVLCSAAIKAHYGLTPRGARREE